MSRRFLRRLEKNNEICQLKNQIKSINLTLIFMVVAAIVAVYINHTGVMLSYGIIVAAFAMIILALFLSYRIKQQVKLSSMSLDYRNAIVKPVIAEFFENGEFHRNGCMTEREILATQMFSDLTSYKYDSKNEIKGTYHGINLKCYDMREQTDSVDESAATILGRIIQLKLDTGTINPVVFISKQAPSLRQEHARVHRITVGNMEIDSKYNVFAFDSNEGNNTIDRFSGKLLKIRDAGFGDVIKTSCYGDELYFYFRVDDESFERQFTKKMDLHEEVDKVCKKLEDIKKVVDLLS